MKTQSESRLTTLVARALKSESVPLMASTEPILPPLDLTVFSNTFCIVT